MSELTEYISIRGDRVNNLKNIDVRIPHDKLIVITGVSGSGKSSLAFDTLYSEGQRRYVESLSTYARQFLGRMAKPDCDFIEGISPAIAIEQKVSSRNPRSTVGTSTEINDYLRMLFARIGRTYSPVSGREVRKDTADDIVRYMTEHEEGKRFMVLTPLVIRAGRTLREQLDIDYKTGFQRVVVDGETLRITDFIADERSTDDNTNVLLVIDRLKASNDKATVNRLADSSNTALYEGDGRCILLFDGEAPREFSLKFEADGIAFEEPSDQMFSFNSPIGACPECEGYGKIIGIDESLVIPDPELSVYEGAVACWKGEKMSEWKKEFVRTAERYDFPVFTPYSQLTQQQKDFLWHGVPEVNEWSNVSICIDEFFRMLRENQYKIQYRVMLSRYRGKTTCPSCHGTRLKKEATWVKIGGKSICDLVEMSILNLQQWFKALKLDDNEQAIAKRLLTEINNRLQFLVDVGLDYLTLNRQSNTLSGGESQRINLTTSLGSSLVGSLYVLDEPSIGLHSRDTDKLIKVLKELRDIGNTVVVVEHDEDILRAADYIIDVGPDAGHLGGEIVYEGTIQQIYNETESKSHTVNYLNGHEAISCPTSRRAWNQAIEIKGARMNNLKGLDVKFPLNVMTVVTGVSGSGKSSLVKGILYPALKRHLDEVAEIPGEYSSIEGDWQSISHVEMVDQNPIGKSSRSNPATYVKAYDAIRQLYADQPLSKQLGLTPQHFSFNADGGRCEECKGAGFITVEMQFMADLVLECDSCHGKRFKKDILEVMFHGKNIYDVLNMTVSEAIDFFGEYKQKTIVERLRPLEDVGLGYVKLGQNSSTLSGGENQRVKLAYFIGQEKQQPTLFIFDEPTTGLHFHDIQRLLNSFNALIRRGHTIIIIEHNLDIAKNADYIIDLGPEGGNKGGYVVCCGTPEEICNCEESYTAKSLKEKLEEKQ